MAAAQSFTAFNLPTPLSSTDAPGNDTAPRRPRQKRQLTAPADPLLGETIAQPDKRARLADRLDGVRIATDVDELLPQFQAMGKASLYTPPSSGFDSAFVPFVLDDGVLSFYTPTDSPESSDIGNTPDLPSSAFSESFSDGFLDEYYHSPLSNAPTFRNISIWRGGEDRPAHTYTQMLDNSLTQDAISFGIRDSSATRYGLVYAEVARLPCQFIHVDVPLTAEPSPSVGEQELLNSSTVTISSLHRGSTRLLTDVYNQGTLVSSHEVQMEEHVHSEVVMYSAPLPQDLVDGLCTEMNGLGREQTKSSGKDYLDGLAMMRFVQQGDSDMDGEATGLVIAVEFYAVKGSSLDVDHSLQSASPAANNLTTSSSLPRRNKMFSRPMPKLSVAIPPPNMHGVTGVQLCTQSPESSVRPTPITGIPSNVGPVTPFEQLIHTPLSPPPLPQSSARSRSGYAPTPSESSYPFTLSSMSPGSDPTSAYSALDSSTGMGSAPAWLTRARNVTPFTPSFFMQYPHTASASNAMSSLTQRALDAGSPAALRRDEYFSQPLASPLPIASGTTSLTSREIPNRSGTPNTS